MATPQQEQQWKQQLNQQTHQQRRKKKRPSGFSPRHLRQDLAGARQMINPSPTGPSLADSQSMMDQEQETGVPQWQRDEQYRQQLEQAKGKNATQAAGDDKKKKKSGIAKKAKQVVEAAGKYLRLLTGRVLQGAWLGLLESFGLTILYIDFHFTMYYMGGPFKFIFMQPGQEWMMGAQMALGEGEDAATAGSSDTAKQETATTAKEAYDGNLEKPDDADVEEEPGGSTSIIRAEAKLMEYGEGCGCCVINALLLMVIGALAAIVFFTFTCEGREIFTQYMVGGTLGEIAGSVVSTVSSLLPTFTGGCF